MRAVTPMPKSAHPWVKHMRRHARERKAPPPRAKVGTIWDYLISLEYEPIKARIDNRTHCRAGY